MLPSKLFYIIILLTQLLCPIIMSQLCPCETNRIFITIASTLLEEEHHTELVVTLYTVP